MSRIKEWDFITAISIQVNPDLVGRPRSFGDEVPDCLVEVFQKHLPTGTGLLTVYLHVEGRDDPGVWGGPPDAWEQPYFDENRTILSIDALTDSEEPLATLNKSDFGEDEELSAAWEEFCDYLEVEYPDDEEDWEDEDDLFPEIEI